nr:hypothetical protein [Aeromicrobium sp. SORGH_AS_0981]
MPQVVQRHVLDLDRLLRCAQVRRLDRGAEDVVPVRAAQHAAGRRGEHEVLRSRPVAQALGAELLDQPGRDRHAARLLALRERRVQPGGVVEGGGDRQPAAVEVEPSPAQRRELAETQPGVHERHGHELVVDRRQALQDRAELLALEEPVLRR